MMWMQMLMLWLPTAELEARLKGGEAGLQGLPGILDRQQQYPIAEALRDHLGATEAVRLRQTHRLTAAGSKQTRRIHRHGLAWCLPVAVTPGLPICQFVFQRLEGNERDQGRCAGQTVDTF
jgi:hypothetical protein